MADPKEKNEDIAIMESNDGSATVDLPEDMSLEATYEEENVEKSEKNEHEAQSAEDTDHPDDDDELPPAIIPTAPQLKLIVLRGRFETPQNDTLPHLQFESAFNPRGPPQLGGTTSA